jgi:hypothetical protein
MDTLKEIFEQLQKEGAVRTKKEFAEMLGINYANLVAAMNGNPRSNTPSLLAKAIRFRDEKLGPAEPPQPDAKEAALDRLLTNMMDAHQIAMKTLEQNDRLIALLETEARMRTGFAPEIAEGKNARSAEE